MELQNDQQIVEIQKNGMTLQGKATSLVVKDELTSKSANDIALTLKNMIKQLEDKRTYYIKPANETVKRINASFREKAGPLKDALAIIRGKIQTYMIDARRKAEKAQEEKNKQEQAFLETKEVAPVQPVAPTHVTSSFGKSFLQKRWTWELEDLNKVPDEFKLLNEKKVNALIRANTETRKGVSSCSLKIEGIKIYQQEGMGTIQNWHNV